MARIFITGSTEGLGLAAGRALIADGHAVVFHARSTERAASLEDAIGNDATVLVGDLSSDGETRRLAGAVNTIGRMDAVIHNAGVYRLPGPQETAEGHTTTFAVNVLAPYLLTALIQRPDRLVYLSSGMHRQGDPSLRNLDGKPRPWDATQAYCDSKLYVAAFAAAVARRWPDVFSNSVDPGWVPTRMGGAGAPDDLDMGHQTQAWLAASDDPATKVSGSYWRHREQREAAPSVTDEAFQDALLERLATITGIRLS